MIYTVTFNPSLDYILEGETLSSGGVNRAQRVRMDFGGKGINQSAVLNALGVPNVALGFAGGHTGQKLQAILDERRIKACLIPIAGETRINVKLRMDKETEINAPGPDIFPEELAKMLMQIDHLGEGDVLSVGGSVPPSVPDTIIRDILARIKGRGVFTVVDAQGGLLRRSLEEKPDLIKPNWQEALDLLGLSTDHGLTAEQIAQKMRRMGAKKVILSLGGEGAVFLDETGEPVFFAAPKGEAKGTTGAGDSLLAGFLAGSALGRDPVGAFHLGVAAGSATAFAGRLATRDEIMAVEAKMRRR